MSHAKGRASRVGFVSLGCAKNLVDTEVMLGLLQKDGHALVPDPARADVLVVNTCGFIGPAKEESIARILEMAEYKKAGSCKRLIVAGCMASHYRSELEEALPEIDGFVTIDTLERIREHCRLDDAPPAASVEVPTSLYDHKFERVLTTPPWTAYLKVAEGCDNPCTFCIIPTFRGKFRSRTVESLAAEARVLAERGVKEINLVAQDTSAYGRDLGDPDMLAALLRALDKIPALRWIRAFYFYPTSLRDSVLDAMAETKKTVPYIDIPFQHAARSVLRRMQRGGDAVSYMRLLDKMRRKVKGVALRTTFIVGFPGETKAEFRTLMQFVKDAEFDHMGVFPYSKEDGTPAAAMEGDVPPEAVEERQALLMEAQRKISRRKLKALAGRRVEVLCEGPHPETELLLRGRMATQAPDMDGGVLIADPASGGGAGRFVEVEITESHDYDVTGRVVEKARRARAAA
jgi:ribosomal protein S12 methylthiotransferase